MCVCVRVGGTTDVLQFRNIQKRTFMAKGYVGSLRDPPGSACLSAYLFNTLTASPYRAFDFNANALCSRSLNPLCVSLLKTTGWLAG